MFNKIILVLCSLVDNTCSFIRLQYKNIINYTLKKLKSVPKLFRLFFGLFKKENSRI